MKARPDLGILYSYPDDQGLISRGPDGRAVWLTFGVSFHLLRARNAMMLAGLPHQTALTGTIQADVTPLLHQRGVVLHHVRGVGSHVVLCRGHLHPNRRWGGGQLVAL